MAYYLEHKGACELDGGNKSGYDMLVEASRLGNMNALFIISSNKLLNENDLSQVFVLKDLASSESFRASMNASFLLGSFLVVDKRAKQLIDFNEEARVSLGIALIEKSSESAAGYFSYYLRSVLRVEALNESERLALKIKGDILQKNLLGDIQEDCSVIFRHISKFQLDNDNLYEECPE